MLDGTAGAWVSFDSFGLVSFSSLGWVRKAGAWKREGIWLLLSCFPNTLQSPKKLTVTHCLLTSPLPATDTYQWEILSPAMVGDLEVSTDPSSPVVILGSRILGLRLQGVLNSSCWDTLPPPLLAVSLLFPSFLSQPTLDKAIAAFLHFHVFQLWRFMERTIFLPYWTFPKSRELDSTSQPFSPH